MDIPILSIVVLTYGHEQYISDTIKGIFRQNFEAQIELIISNDNSPDNSDLIIQDLIQHAPANILVKYTKHDSNIGMLENYDWAIKQCNGKYIAFCEGDDYWINSDKLKIQIEFLERNPDFGLTFTDVNFINAEKEILYENVFRNKILPIHNSLDEFIVRKLYFAPCTWLGKNEYFHLTEKSEFIADATFALMIVALSKTKVHFVNETTANYRLLDESASRTKDLTKKINRQINLFITQKFYQKKLNRSHLSARINKGTISDIAYTLAEMNDNVDFFSVIAELKRNKKITHLINEIIKWTYIKLIEKKLPFTRKLKIVWKLGVSRISRRAMVNFIFNTNSFKKI